MMEKVDSMEFRLLNWARWRLTKGTGALGYASINLEAAEMPREPYADAPIPTSAIEGSETDEAVMRLPSHLRATVECHYVASGTLAEKLRRLCITKSTLYERIRQAKVQLAEHFAAKQDRARRAREDIEALQRSVRPG